MQMVCTGSVGNCNSLSGEVLERWCALFCVMNDTCMPALPARVGQILQRTLLVLFRYIPVERQILQWHELDGKEDNHE